MNNTNNLGQRLLQIEQQATTCTDRAQAKALLVEWQMFEQLNLQAEWQHEHHS